MQVQRTPQSRGAYGDLGGLDHGTGDRDWQEDVGVADRIVIEEVLRPGAEVPEVEDPAMQRQTDPELELLVALAMQRQERELVLLRKRE